VHQNEIHPGNICLQFILDSFGWRQVTRGAWNRERENTAVDEVSRILLELQTQVFNGPIGLDGEDQAVYGTRWAEEVLGKTFMSNNLWRVIPGEDASSMDMAVVIVCIDNGLHGLFGENVIQ